MISLLKKIFLSLTFISVSFSVFAFSKENILSPVEGKWSNVQPLVITSSEDCEIYYSLTNSDPLVSGFSYDGEVILNQTGDVSVNIVVIAGDGRRSDYQINYYVEKKNYYNLSTEEFSFAENINQNPVYIYNSGEKFSIPSSFKFSFDNSLEPYIQGRDLKVNSMNALNRYIPCTATNGDFNFHFVLYIKPSKIAGFSAGEFLERTVPFKFTDWDSLYFTGKNLIYQIDDENWTWSKNKIYLDRSISHVIRWQSVDYKKGNPVSEFVIPVKPNVVVASNSDGSQTLSIPENYKFQLSSSSDSNSIGHIEKAMYNNLCIDTFFADSIDGQLNFDIYYENVFQGKIGVNLEILKKQPVPPQIVSSRNDSYSREVVSAYIQGQEGCQVFYALSEPLILTSTDQSENEKLYSSVECNEFLPYDGKVFQFASEGIERTFHKLVAYSVDKKGNKSDNAEFYVIVDQFNFYINEDLTASKNDGSYFEPFTSFSDALKVINKDSITRLTLLSDINLENETYNLTSNCIINGNSHKLNFGEKTFVKASDATVEFYNLILNCQSTKNNSLFNLDNSVLTFNSSEVVVCFDKNGIFTEASLSEINIKSSGFTIQSSIYSCIFSLTDCAVNSDSSRFTSISPTCVNFVLEGGNSYFINNSFSVIGNTIRCIDFYDTNSELVSNEFTFRAEENKKNLDYIWKDAGSHVSEKDSSFYGL